MRLADALTLDLCPATAAADVLVCAFNPQDCLPDVSRDPFEITIDTHHNHDAPMFAYGGITASIITVPDHGVPATSYVTLGHVDREIVTLFRNASAIHTRHFLLDDQPIAQTSPGRCTLLN